MNFEKIFLNVHNGNLRADLMFIGLGASLGYDWKAKPTPMANSKSGDNFDFYLEQAGLTRYDVFTTNSVLHTPQVIELDETGKPVGRKSRDPNPEERSNCSGFIAQLIALVDPLIVIALGSKALGALTQIEDHTLSMSKALNRMYDWNGRYLTAVFHPSPMTLNMRSKQEQVEDYRMIVKMKERIHGGR